MAFLSGMKGLSRSQSIWKQLHGNFVYLALFADALEGLRVRFLVDELAGLGVAFGPAIVLRIVGLAAVTDCTVPVSVAVRRVGGHGLHFSPVTRLT